MWRAAGLVALFLMIDVPFFAANVAKITHGGWVPIALGLLVFALMTTWKTGRATLAEAIRGTTLPLDLFIADIQRTSPHRVAGTAVFMTQALDGVPPALLHHFKHNKVLHQQVLLLSVRTEDVPEVPRGGRVELTEIGCGFWQVIARYGFMQTPSVPEIMKRCREKDLRFDEANTSYYLGRETLLTTGPSRMARWRKALFVFMSRNARPATAFFGIPPGRVVELGTQIEF
jgi:KUP system potassium uptake protein